MSVEMKPISSIKARLGIEPNGRVQKFFTNTCYKYMDKYVPKETGDLRTIVSLEDNLITYESDYSHYQYKGISKNGNPLNYKTPGTGAYWDLKMKQIDMQEVLDEVQKEIKRG